MKIAVFSDSHGLTAPMISAAEREGAERIVHLGDLVSDVPALRARFPGIPLHCVRGNCDWGSDCPEEELLELCGWKVLLTHGHLYHVKRDLNMIARRGADLGAGLVLFGHTHRAYIGQAGRTRLFNPGAAGGRIWSDTAEYRRTYGIAELDEVNIRCGIREG